MEQVLCNSKGAIIARMPRPVIDKNNILVEVHYSMISIGTEVAPLKASIEASSQEMSIQKAREYGELAKAYLGAALKDPKKAVRRIVEIGSGVIESVIPEKEIAPIEAKNLSEIDWIKCDAKEFTKSEEGINVLTNDSEATYQLMSEKFVIEPGKVPIIEVTGEVLEGEVSIGLLNGNKSRWLGSRNYDVGVFEDKLIFKPDENLDIIIVIANCGANKGSRINISSMKIIMAPAMKSGLPYSELDDQGWNVGYSAAGRVLEVGTNVKDIAVGDLVCCGGAGKANHAELVSIPRNLACKVPVGCDLPLASTTTIGTIALQGVRRAETTLGENICVIGLGLLGQLTAQMLNACGCDVVGFDLSEERVSKAKSLGMKHGTSENKAFINLIRDITGGKGADRTIITAATKSDAVINLAMEVTRAKGRVVIVGDVGLNVERGQFYRKEIDLVMSTSYGPGRYDSNYEEEGHDYPFSYVRWTLNRNMESYMALVAEGKIDVESLVSEICPVDFAPQMYQELAESSTPPLAVIFQYQRSAGIDPGKVVNDQKISIQGHRKAPEGPAKYALVGAGAFGLSMLVPQMQKRKDLFFLKGIVSKSGIQASNYARSNQVEVLTSDLGSILKDETFELLVISTRHNEHASQVIQGLNAGKHVFVEKPLALTWQEFNEIADAYGKLEKPCKLMVGFNRRFSPAMQKLKEAIADRRSPLIVNYRLNGGYIPGDSWVQNQQGGGRNLGEACHMYDVFRFLAGKPVESIKATSINPGNLPYFRNDNFSATMSYQDGSVGNLIYTALGPKTGLPKERVEVFCDGEAYIVDDYKKLVRCSDEEVLWSSSEVDKGHFTELERFGEAIKNNTEAPLAFHEIMETTAATLRVEDLLFNEE